MFVSQRQGSTYSDHSCVPGGRGPYRGRLRGSCTPGGAPGAHAGVPPGRLRLRTLQRRRRRRRRPRGPGPEPGDARADGRVPSGRWTEGAGARWRTPSARPRGARRGRPSQLRSRQFCVLRWALGPACPVTGAGCRVLGPLLSPARPPSLRPALRAPRSGSHRRRPQPFIAAAASADAAHWLGGRVPASSRLPTARQVEASARRPDSACRE